MIDDDATVVTKICPCCNWIDTPKVVWPVAEYLARGLALDLRNRVKILCDDCITNYTWKGI